MALPAKRFIRVLPAVLFDAFIAYAALVAAYKIRVGVWDVALTGAGLTDETNLLPAAAISVVSYVTTLVLAGLYRVRAADMHLDEFLRIGAAMLAGWAVALTLTYLIVPEGIPPRSVTAAQCAFTMIGILGSRAVVRHLTEDRARNESRVTVSEVLADLDPASLIDRAPVTVDEAPIRDYLAGRSVLVTGAGGSIGSVLSERLMALNPLRLVLIDVSEYNLFQLENALRSRSFEGELEFRIADVRDEAIMRTAFSTHRPDIVFHAAAYKHVPLMERHPVEAFRNNTLSTVSLIRLCEEYEAEQFIFISTDKAVEPASVLGATKRLAEWYVRTANAPMRCKTVRFGNILASHGSVIPTFVEQILRGGPVTVTHPDMERFFMTAEEACALVVGTLLLDTAPVYTLKMGAPVRIKTLATRLIDRLDRAGQVSVEYVGMRPGEKLA
jgi:FlaA1/EpsC-like NDP-sugar epimerase